MSELRWEDVAPRRPEERFRIYRVRGVTPDADSLELIATTETKQGMGLALHTLWSEGEFDGFRVGVLDTLVTEDEQPAEGKWIVNPFGPTIGGLTT